MKLPTFLIVGVQKAGTTSIYGYLKQHPQVYMSPVKETNFFSTDWEKQTEKKSNTGKKKRINSWDKYCELFQNVKDEIAIGEASPNYLANYKTSSEMIQRYLPDAKMIAILRNPVDRAYSDYLMHVRDAINVGKVRSLREQAQFHAETSSTIKKGFYYTPVKHYFDTFGKEKLKIVLYDDFCRDSLGVMQDIYKYIGVDNTFNPDTSKKQQTAAIPKNQTFNNLLQTKNPIRTAISSVLKVAVPLELRQKIRSSLIKLNSGGKELMPLSSEDHKLLTELYREDILKLQYLIQTDLSSWLKF